MAFSPIAKRCLVEGEIRDDTVESVSKAVTGLQVRDGFPKNGWKYLKLSHTTVIYKDPFSPSPSKSLT